MLNKILACCLFYECRRVLRYVRLSKSLCCLSIILRQQPSADKLINRLRGRPLLFSFRKSLIERRPGYSQHHRPPSLSCTEGTDSRRTTLCVKVCNRSNVLRVSFFRGALKKSNLLSWRKFHAVVVDSIFKMSNNFLWWDSLLFMNCLIFNGSLTVALYH